MSFGSLFLALALTGVSQGQNQAAPPVGFEAGAEFFGGPITLLGYKPIQEELKLTAEQKQQLDGLRHMSRPDSIPGVKIRNLQGVQQSARNAVTRILNSKQQKRLGEIILQGLIQSGGLAAVIDDPGLDLALEVTDAQKKRLRTIVEANRKPRAPGKTSSTGDFKPTKVEEERRKLADSRINAILTETQKAKLSELQGESFKHFAAIQEEHQKRHRDGDESKKK